MLEFRVEWEDAPGVADPLLRETWARLEFRLDGRPLTRYWSDGTRSLRDGVYGSVFPLAEWFANQWWFLLHEGPRHPFAAITGVRRAPTSIDLRRWLARHNLLMCREGMAYPDLTIFRQDRRVALSWSADPTSATTPGRFIDEGMVVVDHAVAEAALDSFVTTVLDRVQGVASESATELRELWAAIRESTRGERSVCERLAMLGLDPYAEDADEDIISTIETLSFPDAVVTDLLSATTPKAIGDDVAATTALLDELHQCPADPHETPRIRLQTRSTRPYEIGYARAASLRRHLDLKDEQPVPDLDRLLARALGQRPVQVWQTRDRANVEAAVKVNGSAAIAATQRAESGRRFLLGRALHHWLFVTEGTAPRLLTRGQDWSQAASRAFSAELLAPARALAARLGDGADWGERQEELAREFNVHPYVIAHQLTNHRLV